MALQEVLPYLVRMQSEQANGKQKALIALGQQIRKVRTANGISQEAFAATAGIGRSYFGGVERGQRNISAMNLMIIAAALQVEVGQLFPSREEFSPLLTGVSPDDRGE